MTTLLLDSGVLIWHLRGRSAYRTLLGRLAEEGDLVLSAMTRVEIIRGMREHERTATIGLLDSFPTLPLDSEVADVAGELALRARVRGVTMESADAVIAGTAVRHGADLVTTNSSHFSHLEIVVWHVDPNGEQTRIGD